LLRPPRFVGVTSVSDLIFFQRDTTAWLYSATNGSTIQLYNTNISQITGADFIL
jgi:hypothetical protein